MTPAQSDAMCAALGQVLAWDDRFFMQRPDRGHRIRRAYPAEIQFHQWRGVLAKTIPDGLRVFVGKSLDSSTRCAVGFMPPDTETDVSERDAARLFAVLATHDTLNPNSYVAQTCAAPSSLKTRGRIE